MNKITIAAGSVTMEAELNNGPTAQRIWEALPIEDMEEVALTRERLFQTILEDVNVFFNVNLKIEMLKAIPRGEGITLMRIYEEK